MWQTDFTYLKVIGWGWNHRYHESIGNLTPAGVYTGHGETILAESRRIKRQTIQNRRLNHQRQAA